MAGTPGRSGRRPRPRPGPYVVRGPGPRVLPASLLEGMGPRGAAFIEAAWKDEVDWPPSSLVLLREAGMLIDRLEAQRGDKGEAATQRLLLNILATLQARRPAGAAAPPASKWRA
jgi:hypothetical protein